jgi:hypothetical protein
MWIHWTKRRISAGEKLNLKDGLVALFALMNLKDERLWSNKQ